MKNRLLSIALVCAMLAAMFAGLTIGVGAAYTDKSLTNGAWTVTGSAIDAVRLNAVDQIPGLAKAAVADDRDSIAASAFAYEDNLLAYAELSFAEGGKTDTSTVSVTFKSADLVDGQTYTVASDAHGELWSELVVAENGALTVSGYSQLSCFAVFEGSYYSTLLPEYGYILFPIASMTDVDMDNENFFAINTLVVNGIIGLKADGKFLPDEAVTRETAAMAFYRLATPETIGTNPFADVDKHEWFANGCIWAGNLDLMVGIGEAAADGLKMFGVGKELTVEQLAAVMYRVGAAVETALDIDVTEEISGMAIKEYTDYASISSWAVESMAYCAANGLILPDEDNNLNPQKTVTRGEFAYALSSLQEYLSDKSIAATDTEAAE